ncbi:MAG TPA: hypothetical protein VLB67_01960 [Acidimicrobiia bacterium]|nr:hypothetical protein [Acidimicrobiia bacterium]
MTNRRCAWCGVSFAAGGGPGRPARFCRRSHRQRAYEARRLAESHGLGPDDILLSREAFEQLRDLLYRIEAALQDIDGDLAGGADSAEYRQALWHLYRTAATVRTVSFEPRAIGGT